MRSTILAASATALVIAGGIIGARVMESNDADEFVGASVPDRSAEVQRLADETFRSFNGSKYQRDAGAVVANYAESGPPIQCMRDHGITAADWSLPRPVNPESRGLETSVLFAPPGVHTYTETLMSTAPGARPGVEDEDSGLTAEQEAIADDCWESAPAEEASSSPRVAKDLRLEWWAMVSELDESLGSETDYWRCLSDKDIDGTTGIDSTMARLKALEARTPPGYDIPDSPDSEAARNSQWLELVAFEGMLRDAEFDCRAETYNDGIDAVGDRISQFKREHAAEIAEAQDGWADIVVEAEGLGYTGAYESLVANTERD